MIAADDAQRTQPASARRPDPPAPRLFNVNVADIPSVAIGMTVADRQMLIRAGAR